jgi:hypothetical protein
LKDELKIGEGKRSNGIGDNLRFEVRMNKGGGQMLEE